MYIDRGASGLPHRNSPILGPCLEVRGDMGQGLFHSPARPSDSGAIPAFSPRSPLRGMSYTQNEN